MSSPRRTPISEVACAALPFTVHDARWVPSSRRLVVVGAKPRARGALRVCSLNTDAMRLETLLDAETERGARCATLGACDAVARECAVGDYAGFLQVFDLLRPQQPVFSARVHDELVNCIDGGGAPGPREVATGSRDGRVRVSDVRCAAGAVASLDPRGEQRDCWSVAVGRAGGARERSVFAGFDNGDVKLWDLRANAVVWEANVGSGVVSLQARGGAEGAPEFAAGCLSGALVCGSAGGCAEVARAQSAIWAVQRCPQRPEMIAAACGSGELVVWEQSAEDPKRVEEVMERELAAQPLASLDWHPDCAGLAAVTAYDQTVRVVAVADLM